MQDTELLTLLNIEVRSTLQQNVSDVARLRKNAIIVVEDLGLGYCWKFDLI